MTIRKIAGCALAALFLLGTAGDALPQTTISSSAEDAAQTALLTTDNASLFLPESYEQYLELDSPTDVAFSQGYIAIADGGTMYVYDRSGQTGWRMFSAGESSRITKIQFSGNTLYYSARNATGGNSFWYYDCSDADAQPESTAFNCSTFLIVEDTLYTVSISGNLAFASRSLSALDSATDLGELTSTTEPFLAYANDRLYCIINDRIYEPNANGQFNDISTDGIADSPFYYISDNAQQANNVTSACSNGADLFFSSSAGLFRRGTGAEGAVTELSGTNGPADMRSLSAMSFYNGSLYCISGTSIHEISVTDSSAAFTDFEIASSSDSANRLSGAADMARAGNLLVMADTGNSRVSVYNFSTGDYATIPCEGTPSLVATDGEIIAYASGTQVYTCDYAAGETVFTSAALTGTEVRGIAVSYGETYYVKSNGTRGTVGSSYVETSTSPTGLACDLYGNLFVSYENGSVRSFTEEEFTTSSTGTDTGITVATDATSLRADFEGNLYYLSGGSLYKNGTLFAQIDGSDFVYTSSATAPLSFALGFEDDAVYFNFGNYLVASHASTEEEAGPLAGIPTLGEIAESGAREAAFSLHEGTGLTVTVAARAVGIDTDLTAFRDSDSAFFPYSGYSRATQERQGLLLAATPDEAGGYSLVLFAEEDGSYTARLYRSEVLTAASDIWQEESGTRWLTNSVGAYYAPCLESALSDETLPRGTQAEVLGYFTAPDREYALIEYESTARERVRGWVPASYLSSVSTVPASGEDYTLAYLKASEDGTVFTGEDGSQRTVTERVQVRLYDNGDGTYTARLADDMAYSATVTDDMIDRDNAEALRIALIVILSVLALVIVGVYIFLLPWEKYRKNRR